MHPTEITRFICGVLEKERVMLKGVQKKKTGVKNITHYKLFLLSNCIQLTSDSIIPFVS